MKTISTAIFFLILSCAFAGANTLDVSVTGQFSSSVTNSQLTAPSGIWAISFNVPGNPTAMKADTLGFDTSFTSFSYRLNGSLISSAPQSIRFSASRNLGLFTLFFGPESGFDSNGNAIPEFSFEGGQAYSGTTSMPTIMPGNYPVSSWTYSDATNYDQHTPSSNVVTIKASAIPEPSGLAMFGVLAIAGLMARRR